MDVQIISDGVEKNICFGLFNDEKLIGTVSFCDTPGNPGTVSLNKILIDKYYRRLGKGSELLSEAERILKNNGIEKIYCSYDTEKDNEALADFFKSNWYADISSKGAILSLSYDDIFNAKSQKKLETTSANNADICDWKSIPDNKKIKYTEQLKKENITLDFEGIDMELSKFAVKDDEISGYLLVISKRDEICIDDYFIRNMKTDIRDFMGMQNAFLKTVAKMEGKENLKFKVCIYQEDILDLYQVFFGKGHVTGKRKEFLKIL